MKFPFYKISAFFAITLFLFYWIVLFILAIPLGNSKKLVENTIPRFSSLVGHHWQLFTPPPTNNCRLYFIVKDIVNTEIIDTIEVLERMSLQKQKNAPFNQRENVLDHLVHNNITGMITLLYKNKKYPTLTEPGTTDSSYIAGVIAAFSGDNRYKLYLATLFNYSKLVLKNDGISTVGKEVKIVIKEKKMLPFKERHNTRLPLKEVLVFETEYTPLTS